MMEIMMLKMKLLLFYEADSAGQICSLFAILSDDNI